MTKMKNKQYTSYEEIDRDLKMLKLQKEIHYQKLLQKGEDIKQSLHFTSILPDIAIGAIDIFSQSAKGAIVGFLLRKIFRRK